MNIKKSPVNIKKFMKNWNKLDNKFNPYKNKKIKKGAKKFSRPFFD